MTFSATLRAAILADPRSCRRLALDAGVSQAVLSRFLAGKRGLTLTTAEKLAGEVGLKLTKKGE